MFESHGRSPTFAHSLAMAAHAYRTIFELCCERRGYSKIVNKKKLDAWANELEVVTLIGSLMLNRSSSLHANAYRLNKKSATRASFKYDSNILFNHISHYSVRARRLEVLAQRLKKKNGTQDSRIGRGEEYDERSYRRASKGSPQAHTTTSDTHTQPGTIPKEEETGSAADGGQISRLSRRLRLLCGNSVLMPQSSDFEDRVDTVFYIKSLCAIPQSYATIIPAGKAKQ